MSLHVATHPEPASPHVEDGDLLRLEDAELKPRSNTVLPKGSSTAHCALDPPLRACASKKTRTPADASKR